MNDKNNDKLEMRKHIDTIDQQIMKLLNERFNYTTKIADLKVRNKDEIYDAEREKSILKKTDAFSNASQIASVYQSIMQVSKEMQKNVFYLLGGNLSYSYSKLIHKLLGNSLYYPTEISYLDDFIKHTSFKGLNITNPFKTDAYKLASILAPEARLTGVVNTLVSTPNGLYGANTDYLAFIDMLDHYKLNLRPEKVIVVGNGATSTTIQAALKALYVDDVTVVARNPRQSYEVDLLDISKYANATVIINATSYGVYPNIKTDYLFDTTHFYKLKYLIDVNYNPFRSSLALNNRQVKYYNGLYMLVKQAELSEKLFYDNLSSPNTVPEIVAKLKKDAQNIILIGMPFSGKTTIGEKLAAKLAKNFVDMDQELMKDNHDLPSILTSRSPEETFRKYEHELCMKLALVKNTVIACGGGVIKDPTNLKVLSQNGLVIFLDPTLKTLETRLDTSRPLIKSTTDLHELYAYRHQLYQDACDFSIEDNDIDTIIKKIEEKVNEHSYY